MVSELGSRYKIADAERLELKRLIADAQSSRIQLADTLNKHKELEDAHMIQSKFIHKLQKKISKVDKYIETIEMQEKVIMKMQSVMESTAPIRIKKNQNKNQNYDQNNQIPDHMIENNVKGTDNQTRDLENRINLLTEEVR